MEFVKLEKQSSLKLEYTIELGLLQQFLLGWVPWQGTHSGRVPSLSGALPCQRAFFVKAST